MMIRFESIRAKPFLRLIESTTTTTFCKTTKFDVNLKPYASNAFYAMGRCKSTKGYKYRHHLSNFPNTLEGCEGVNFFHKLTQHCSQINQENSLKRKSADHEYTNHFEADFENRGKCAVVYTDGACSSNGKRGAKAGIGVYWGENDSRNISSPLDGRPTNNRAEIHAAIAAIKQAKDLGYSEIIILTDSQFLIDSITCWVKKWQRNGWTLSNGGKVVNKDDFKELLLVMDGINVRWQKVQAHKGIRGNEEADRLAGLMI